MAHEKHPGMHHSLTHHHKHGAPRHEYSGGHDKSPHHDMTHHGDGKKHHDGTKHHGKHHKGSE